MPWENEEEAKRAKRRETDRRSRQRNAMRQIDEAIRRLEYARDGLASALLIAESCDLNLCCARLRLMLTAITNNERHKAAMTQHFFLELADGEGRPNDRPKQLG